VTYRIGHVFVGIVLIAAFGVAYASRPVHESLASVAVRAQRIVVAEIVGVDEFNDGGEHIVDVEAVPEQLMAGPEFDDADAETLFCRYAEQRVQRRGDAVLSPLVSGSGEEFRARRGDRVILLLAPKAGAEVTSSKASPPAETGDAETSEEASTADAENEATPDIPTCTLLRIESLQNRIAILRFLRHAEEAQSQRRAQ
jgi:hypothetical protein